MNNDDKVKAKNVAGLFSNPSTRPMVFITGAVILGVIGVGVLNLSKTASDLEGSASVEDVGTVEHRPGVNTSPQHTALQQEANEEALRQAEQSGSSSLPVITGNTNVNDPLTLPPQNTPQAQVPVTPPVMPTVPQPVVQPVEQVQVPVAPVMEQPKVEVSEAMAKQIEGYLNLWGPANNVLHEYTYATKRKETEGANGGSNPTQVQNLAAASTASVSGSNNSVTPEQAIRYVRAGTMIPAMLITPLNSDAPGPVLAQVTSGPLAGARLIGTMRVNKESILIAFNQISKPGWPDVYPVSAIGMDLKSSTALASDVNHHYLQKYMGLLAGSFMEGYGQGMQQQGTTTIVNPQGGITQTQEDLSSKQAADKAKGNVLQKMGADIQGATDRDVTIKVEGPGGQPFPIKVLFMENF